MSLHDELGMKEHIVRERVNELKELTLRYGHTQQLRGHLQMFVTNLLKEHKEYLEEQWKKNKGQ